jgi:tetratricopeptide (TPR) repeat protein
MMLFRPFDVAGPQAIAAMEHALALDPEQSEALAVKAMMTKLLDYDWETAGRLYKRAIASRESQWAVANYALFYLQFVAQQHRAIELFSQAEKLDPLHAGIKANFAGILYFAGDDDGAIRKAREALQLDSEHVLAIQFLIAAYTNTNDTAALASLLDDIPPAMQELAEIKSLFARSYAVRGDEAKARKIYNDLLASLDSLSPNAMFDTALLAISLGEIDQSIELMERLEKSGSWMQFWNKLLPIENSTIRENPRYQALLKRMGLDDESVKALNERMSFD